MKNESEVLDYIYKNASMGYESTFTLLKNLENKENKIKEVVQDILNSYEQFKRESENLLTKINEDVKRSNPLASISVDMSIKMKINKDNSDTAVAQMLIKGLTMGQNEMEKILEELDKEMDEKVIDLIKDFGEFQKDAIKKLEKYI
jgi:molecular chaperone GrpE (heat shock protein)